MQTSMEKKYWERTNTWKEHRRGRQPTTPTPSFSSSLLDAIYRSIDEGNDFKTTQTHCHNSSSPTTTLTIPRERKPITAPIVTKKPFLSTSTSSDPESARVRTPKSSSSSIRHRFRASRIYAELKKAKSPDSPGGRLAAFLNTLFASATRTKTQTPSASPPPPESSCSSASSYARSCLGKAPSSRGTTKRTVRFNLVGDVRVSAEEQRKREERDLAATRRRGYNEKRGFEEEEDDVASCASSDLFELENLTAVGGGERYKDELPVYETTHFDTNRAIARGLFV